MSGLRDVLAAHALQGVDPYGEEPYVCCTCDWAVAVTDERDEIRMWAEHVEAAVLDWLRARLASDEVREVVARALCESVNPGGFGWREHRDDWHRDADAALAAVVGALAGEGNADSAPEAAKTAPVSDLGPKSGQGDHSDDEGRSGARDGLTCLAAVPPGWPHVPCVRPFKHEGEHSATPKWVDLFGIDPDYTGGQDVNEWLDESRGDA